MSNEFKSAALTALRASVRPIFRIMLRSGVTWQEASEACKSALVEVAMDEFGLHGRPTNMSRVAIMTGLSRREVSRLRDGLSSAPDADTERMTGATRVLTGWYLDPDFTLAPNRPRNLAYDNGAVGGSPQTFTDLCKRYAGDLAAITMRRELVRVGAIEELPGGELRVLKRYYMPQQMDPDSIVRGGSMLEDVGETVAFNLGKPAGTESRFAGRALNTRIRAADVRRFRTHLEQEGQAFLERVDEWLSRHEVPVIEDPSQSRGRRVGVGVFAIVDDRKS